MFLKYLKFSLYMVVKHTPQCAKRSLPSHAWAILTPQNKSAPEVVKLYLLDYFLHTGIRNKKIWDTQEFSRMFIAVKKKKVFCAKLSKTRREMESNGTINQVQYCRF